MNCFLLYFEQMMMADKVDFSFTGKKEKKKQDKKDGTSVSGPVTQKHIGPVISRATRDTEFQTHNESIGIALVFSHNEIKGQVPRTGSEKDRKSIKKALKSFGFEITVFDDLTFEELNAELEKGINYFLFSLNHILSGRTTVSHCIIYGFQKVENF